MVERWLSPEVLQWHIENDSGWPVQNDLRSRSYEILAHAEQVLGLPPSELALVDVITSLRRAIDRRLRALNSLYSFRDIPIRDRPHDLLIQLESLGIIRSHMVLKLIAIRNAVEHEDIAPPDHEACKVFAEFTWYFLKSTDKMLHEVNSSFALNPGGDDEKYYGLEIEYGPRNNWIARVRGWVKPKMIMEDFGTEWICLRIEEMNTRDELAEILKRRGGPMKRNEHGRGKKKDDIYFNGTVRGPASALTKLTEAYFSVI